MPKQPASQSIGRKRLKSVRAFARRCIRNDTDAPGTGPDGRLARSLLRPKRIPLCLDWRARLIPRDPPARALPFRASRPLTRAGRLPGRSGRALERPTVDRELKSISKSRLHGDENQAQGDVDREAHEPPPNGREVWVDVVHAASLLVWGSGFGWRGGLSGSAAITKSSSVRLIPRSSAASTNRRQYCGGMRFRRCQALTVLPATFSTRPKSAAKTDRLGQKSMMC